MPKNRWPVLFLLNLFLLSVTGFSQTYTVAIDSDNDPATGCDFTTNQAAGPQVVTGIEQLFNLAVSYTGGVPIVSSTDVQACDTGTGLFGAPVALAGGWDVGLNNGVGGADVVEGELPGGAPPDGEVLGLVVQANTPPGGADAVLGAGGGALLFPPGLVGIPTLGEWGLILLTLLLAGAGILRIQKNNPRLGKALSLLLITGLAVSTLLAMFVADGDVMDWTGVNPLASDPQGDALLDDPAADITAFFVGKGSLFFRIDVQDLEQDPPVAVDDTGATDEDMSVIIDVLSNDSDPDVGDTIMVQSVTPGANGTVVDNGDGTVTFDPTMDFNGMETFSYTIVDSTGLTDSADVNVTVGAINDPPMAVDDMAAVDEDDFVDIDVLANDSDVEGPLTVQSFTQGADGAVTDQGGGVLRYTPDPDFNGTDSFDYTVINGGSDTDTATVNVTVNPVNDPPVAQDDAVGVLASGVLNGDVTADNGSGADSDVDLDTLTVSEVEGNAGNVGVQIALGSGALLTVNANGTFTYDPNGAYNSLGIGDTATETFTYEISDGNGGTDDATVTVTISGSNQPPTITSSATPSAEENQTTAVDVDSTDLIDSEGSGLTYSITGGADQGDFSIDMNTGVLSFVAAPDFESPGDDDGGNDYEVQVTVTDSGGLTDVQDITVTVTNVNEAPTITSDGGGATASLNAAENQTAVTDVESSDPDGETEGGTLSYSITGGADMGDFSIVAATGVLTFSSAPDFENPGDADLMNDYEVQVTVTDGGALTDVQDITVTVTDVNEAPEITSDGGGATASVSAAENQTSATDVESTDDSDSEGSGLSYSITGGADMGDFSIVAATGVLTFNSAPDFESPGDSDGMNDYEVQVTVTDSGALTDVQDITVTVTDVNEAPVITSDGGGATAMVNVPENTTAVTDVMSTDDSDSEGSGLTYSITGGADMGDFSIVAATGVLTFNSAPDFENPTDADLMNDYEVQVTVTDSGTLMDVQDITVNVTDVVENTAPVITSNGGGATAMISIPENTTAVTDVMTTDDNDSEGSGLTYSKTTTGGGGAGADNGLFTLDTMTGVLTFTAAPDFENPQDSGMDNVYDVQVTVTDSGPGGPLTDFQDIAVTVTDVVEMAPMAVNDPNGGLPGNSTPSNDVPTPPTDSPYHTALNTTLTVPDGSGDLLDNDTLGTPAGAMIGFGPTATPTMFTPGSGPQAAATDQGGTLDVNANGGFTYTPPSATFTGLDTFAYRLSNIIGTSDATVTIGVGLRPSCTDDSSYSSTGNVGISISASGVLANDGGDQIVVAQVQGMSGNVGMDTDTDTAGRGSVMGTVNLGSNGAFTYDPPPGLDGMGTDTFKYHAGNGFGDVECTATVTVDDIIWFVDNSASAGDGRLNSPFNTLADFETANGGAGTFDPGTGDCIFLDTGSGADYTGGVTLKDSQILLGQGADAGTDIPTVCGITLATDSFTLPSLLGSTMRPKIVDAGGDAITLASGNTIRGLNLGDTPAANHRIVGTLAGSLAISEVLVGSTGGIIEISTSGALSVTFDSIESSSSSGAAAIDLTGVSGTFTVSNGAGTDTMITGADEGIDIQSSSADFDFSDTSITTDSTGGDGIDLASSGSATFTFDSLDVTAGAGNGILASGAGTINVTGSANDISATGGAGVDIDSTSLNITLATISTTNSPDHGIDLTSVSGIQFTATGNVTIDMAAGSNQGINVVSSTLTNLGIGTGALATVDVNDRRATGIFLDTVSNTITFGDATIPNPNNAGGYGIRVEDSAGSFTFSETNISDTNQTVARADGGADGVPDAFTYDGVGISISNLSGSFTSNGGTIDNIDDHGVDIIGGTSGTIDLLGVTISNVGLIGSGAVPQTVASNGVNGYNFSGTFLLEDATVSEFDGQTNSRGVQFLQVGTSFSEIRVKDTSFSNTGGALGGDDAILLRGEGAVNGNFIVEDDFAVGNASHNSTFSGLSGEGVQTSTGNTLGSGTVDVAHKNLEFIDAFNAGGFGGVDIGIIGSAAIDLESRENEYDDLYRVQALGFGVVHMFTFGTSRITGVIDGGDLSGNASNAPVAGRRGIMALTGDLVSEFVADFDLTINDIDIHDTDHEAIYAIVNGDALTGGGAPPAELRVSNSRIGSVTDVARSGREGLEVLLDDTNTAGIGGNKTLNLLLFSNLFSNADNGSTDETADIDCTAQPGTTALNCNATVVGNTFTSNGNASDEFEKETNAFGRPVSNGTANICLDLRNNTVSEGAGSGNGSFQLDQSSPGSFDLNSSGNTGTIQTSGTIGSIASCTLPTGTITPSLASVSQMTTVSTGYGALTVTLRKGDGTLADNGTTVTFAAPGAGASGTFPSGASCMTSGGSCSVDFIANATAGAFDVMATASGFESAKFFLRNTP